MDEASRQAVYGTEKQFEEKIFVLALETAGLSSSDRRLLSGCIEWIVLRTCNKFLVAKCETLE